MKLNIKDKQLIITYINDIDFVLNKYVNHVINDELFNIIKEKLYLLHILYKEKSKIFNIIYAFPTKEKYGNITIHITVDDYTQNSRELKNYIINCVNSYCLLHNL